MCRWMAYSGKSVPLEDLLFLPKHNLIDQSLSAKSRETPTNGDGFGVGWYRRREQPGLYHTVRPAWNDFNLRDPPAALARMAGFVEEVGRAHGVANPLWATVAATDGETIYSFRYSSDGDAPSLYFSRSATDLLDVNPRIAERLGDKARAIVSEPIGAFAQIWAEVPQASFLTVRDGAAELSGFAPRAA